MKKSKLLTPEQEQVVRLCVGEGANFYKFKEVFLKRKGETEESALQFWDMMHQDWFQTRTPEEIISIFNEDTKNG